MADRQSSKVSESTTLKLENQRLSKVVDRLKRLTLKYRSAEVVQKALFRISELAASARQMDNFYSSVHAIIGELMFAKNFYICLYDVQSDVVNFVYFVDEYDEMSMFEQIPMETLSRGLTGYVIRSGRSLLCTPKAFEELKQQGEVEEMGAAPVDWLGVPLIAGDHVIGAMVVQSYNEQVRYDESDKELLTFVSQHVVNALERLRQRELMQAEIDHQTAELRHANESLMKEITVREKAEQQMSVLFAISELTNTSENMRAFYRSLHEEIGHLLHADNFYVALLSDDRKQIYFPYHVDEMEQAAEPRRLGKGLTEYVIRSGEPIFVDEAQRQRLIQQHEVELSAKHGRTALQWLASPLIVDEEVIGVIAVQTYDDAFLYKSEDLELLNFVSQHVAVAIERKRAADEIQRVNAFLEKKVSERTEELVGEIERRKKIEARLFHDAHHDSLTGLPNRAMFTERLQQAVAHHRRHNDHHFAVLFIDLDRFKNINDTLGHSVGDKFLLEVSQRLGRCIRENDMLARLGGDEFVVLLDTIEELDDAKEVAGRIIRTMAEPFQLEGREYYSGASIGIADCSEPVDTADRLLRDADAAMYQAKNLGRGRYVIFDSSIHDGLVESIKKETALRHARFDEEFELHAQPIVDLQTRQVMGYEGLLRWNQHGQKLLPVDFMQLAEKSGIILELDRFALRKSCEFIVQQSKRNESFPLFHINLSVRHLLKSGYLRKIEQIVKEAGVRPQQLVFEFNEIALIYDGRRVLASLRTLSNKGFNLAIDDFGRGSGPLQFIYNYPFDILKLDHQYVGRLVTSERAQAMLRHVVTLCDDLGINIFAEGIESAQQLELVKELGVKTGQGRYLDGVKPLAELTRKRKVSA
ncbi:hypothetical protein CWI84_03065 [Idiomarina tyrosinivorans]|uniref:Bifunctional diguanylate cyclase/phosphodiesterase n=1 Tax=Idiomarina tyrosinivorans TaxID=1445662 RepID=A0A432ZTJ1_9GAMM|nr:EAL domain-containing protein [Idiomarina tyrosinivorans]RUO81106.1 hypothetical protein CWI84_03065 [Idiomarina tyrosinivorans]